MAPSPIPRTPVEAEILAAADAIVDAFSETDTARYFAQFSADATFIFHPEPARLNSRAEYEALWASWLSSGWRVADCASTDRLVQTFPGGGVFSHTVATSIESSDGPDSYLERESIIFAFSPEGDLVAVHEHLSPIPAPPAPAAAVAAAAAEEAAS